MPKGVLSLLGTKRTASHLQQKENSGASSLLSMPSLPCRKAEKATGFGWKNARHLRRYIKEKGFGAGPKTRNETSPLLSRHSGSVEAVKAGVFLCQSPQPLLQLRFVEVPPAHHVLQLSAGEIPRQVLIIRGVRHGHGKGQRAAVVRALGQLARSEGGSEPIPPESPHQPHSHCLPRIITGLPQCGHRIAIDCTSLTATIVTGNRSSGKTYRLSSQAMPAAVRSAACS